MAGAVVSPWGDKAYGRGGGAQAGQVALAEVGKRRRSSGEAKNSPAAAMTIEELALEYMAKARGGGVVDPHTPWASPKARARFNGQRPGQPAHHSHDRKRRQGFHTIDC